ncbi:MAG: zinc-dependent alcohol dehydrogenase family protein [Aggregatilineales bacterium]
MRSQVLRAPSSIDNRPLSLMDWPRPVPKSGEILVQVSVCGICHTDLHVVEGELPNLQLPIIPGHEIVGTVIENGPSATRFKIGDRVGIPWLHEACGICAFCQRGQENLCPYASFTGYTTQGGYAEYTTVAERFAVEIPDDFGDAEAAPLLCAGIVGYRALRLADLQSGERLGLYGYGSSADICIQVARYWNCDVAVFTRQPEHQKLARERGASWVGRAEDDLPLQLDRAIVFAPIGALIPVALKHLRPGGTLCINAIHASAIPELPYSLLWGERTLRTVANATRHDAEEFLPLAAKIPIRTKIQTFSLNAANDALRMLKHSELNGTAVLVCR